ncbi:unnamed protein product, partial [Mesorhabditis belari]|uniref:Gustatory receptor n=1 Tax=Mesorhabditis belari TaxID=2138241 RepID=A0AAF3EQR8_9BILA
MNTSTASTTRLADEISSVPLNDRLIAFWIYIVLEILLISLNTLVFLTIKLCISSKNSAVFRFHCHHCLVNLLQGFIHIVLTLPITFTGRNIYTATSFYWFFRVAVASELINFMTSMLLVLLCAVNAFFIFLSGKLHEKIFSGYSLNLLLAFTWLIPLAETLIETFTDCQKSFSYERLAFAYECLPEQEHQFLFHNFDSYQRLGYPALALLFNIFLYFYIQWVLWKNRKSLGSSKKGRGELFLVFQGLLICLFTGGNAVTFNFIAPILLTGPVVPIGFPLLLNVATMSRAIAEPTLTILFNKSVTQGVKRLFRGQIGTDENRFIVEPTRTKMIERSKASSTN